MFFTSTSYGRNTPLLLWSSKFQILNFFSFVSDKRWVQNVPRALSCSPWNSLLVLSFWLFLLVQHWPLYQNGASVEALTILEIPVSFLRQGSMQQSNLELGCPSSYACTMISSHFSQCLPLSAAETREYPSSEFVTTSGTNFMLNGSKYTVVGWGNPILLYIDYA